MKMEKKQKFFGDRSMIAMLALLSAFPPISIDLYLPALPNVGEMLGTSQTMVNLSLSMFLIFFSMGMLVWGPISEKYGRKPILLIGLVLYILGSLACALATSVQVLILARVVQAFGGGAAGAVATAMVKDLYSGRKRESVLAAVMSMVIIAPVVAPVIGAFVLNYLSWRAIFWALAGVGVVAALLSLLLDETLEQRYKGSLLASMGRLAVVMKNPGFSALLGIFSIVPLPLLAFIGASSFVYVEGFGMSEQMYSYYFGFNALGALAGPLLYIQISRWFSAKSIITGCFGLLIVSGVFMTGYGKMSPLLFALPMIIATLSTSAMRPPSTNLMLSQQEGDTGSVASLINFMGMFMGSIGMFLVSLETGNLIANLGIMQIVVGALGGGLWLVVRGRSFICQPA